MYIQESLHFAGVENRIESVALGKVQKRERLFTGLEIDNGGVNMSVLTQSAAFLYAYVR